MKTAALYARVSTLDQNCEVQLQDLRRHAGQRFAPYREYIDVGVSGAQRHRPQLDLLMKDARKRLFDASAHLSVSTISGTRLARGRQWRKWTSRL